MKYDAGALPARAPPAGGPGNSPLQLAEVEVSVVPDHELTMQQMGCGGGGKRLQVTATGSTCRPASID
jgi:hypothetical protein